MAPAPRFDITAVKRSRRRPPEVTMWNSPGFAALRSGRRSVGSPARTGVTAAGTTSRAGARRAAARRATIRTRRPAWGASAGPGRLVARRQDTLGARAASPRPMDPPPGLGRGPGGAVASAGRGASRPWRRARARCPPPVPAACRPTTPTRDGSSCFGQVASARPIPVRDRSPPGGPSSRPTLPAAVRCGPVSGSSGPGPSATHESPSPAGRGPDQCPAGKHLTKCNGLDGLTG